ncbi:MAG: ATP synthase subunit I [Polyangiaceae bacterium]
MISDQQPVRSTEPTDRSESPAREPTPATPARRSRRDATLVAAIRMTAVATFGLTVIAGLATDARWATGTLVGGALATLNLLLFARIGENILSPHGRNAPWAVLGALKLLGLFAAVYIILKRTDVSGLAFALGYGALPIGIALSTVVRPRDDGDDEPTR